MHGCRILPELANIRCASQERATQRYDFLRIAAGKTIFLHFRSSHEETRSVPEQITLRHGAWQALGIIILTPARDASHTRGAVTTRQFAGLGARGVTKTTTGTNTSKLRVPCLPAHAQSTRRHNCCRPDGRNHGHITHQLDPRRTYTAATMESYAPSFPRKTAD